MMLRAKKHTGAENAFRQYTKEYPDDFRGYFNLAQVMFEVGDFNQALENYNISIVKNKTVTEAYLGASNLYIKNGRADLALDICLKVFNLLL